MSTKHWLNASRENRNTPKEICRSALYLPQISHGLGWDRTRGLRWEAGYRSSYPWLGLSLENESHRKPRVGMKLSSCACAELTQTLNYCMYESDCWYHSCRVWFVLLLVTVIYTKYAVPYKLVYSSKIQKQNQLRPKMHPKSTRLQTPCLCLPIGRTRYTFFLCVSSICGTHSPKECVTVVLNTDAVLLLLTGSMTVVQVFYQFTPLHPVSFS